MAIIALQREAFRSLLASLSVDGRLAYALTCVEHAAVAEGVVTPVLCDALDLVWSYCQEENLTTWSERVHGRLMPLMAHAAFVYRAPHGHPDDEMAVNDPLRAIPDDYMVAIDDCIDIGMTHLWSTIIGVGVASIDRAERVASWLLHRGLSLPDPEPFRELRFEGLGWSPRFDPARFRALAFRR